MTLQASGAISFSDVNTELGLSSTSQISMNDAAVRTLFNQASGAISMTAGYGKSNTSTPGAPTSVSASATSYSSASVSFSAPACTGHLTIDYYQVISSPGCITATGTSPISVTGLSGSTSYTFRVRAHNSKGYGCYSSSSGSITTPAQYTTGSQFYACASQNGVYTTWVAPASGVSTISVLAVSGGARGSRNFFGYCCCTGQQINVHGDSGQSGQVNWTNNYTVVPGRSYNVLAGGTSIYVRCFCYGGGYGSASYMRDSVTGSFLVYPVTSAGGGSGYGDPYPGHCGMSSSAVKQCGALGRACRSGISGSGGGGTRFGANSGGCGAPGGGSATAGNSGGAGGGGSPGGGGGGGGGIGIYGQGSSGAAGSGGGGGGSGGDSGSGNNGYYNGGTGGNYGGGGGGAGASYGTTHSPGNGAPGFVRILYPGHVRQWPSTCAGA
jgi:hypothetical protein